MEACGEELVMVATHAKVGVFGLEVLSVIWAGGGVGGGRGAGSSGSGEGRTGKSRDDGGGGEQPNKGSKSADSLSPKESKKSWSVTCEQS